MWETIWDFTVMFLVSPFFVVSHWLWVLDIEYSPFWANLNTGEYMLSVVLMHIAAPLSLALYWQLIKAIFGAVFGKSNTQAEKHDN